MTRNTASSASFAPFAPYLGRYRLGNLAITV